MTQRHHHRTCRGILAGTVILPLGLFLVCNSAAAQKPDAPSKALLEDANSYAERFDVNLDEAVRRLQIQSKVGVLEAALARDEQASFAGLWLEHKPTFRVVMSFTDSAAPQRSLPELDSLKDEIEIEVRTARWPLAELEKDQAAAIALANRLGYVVDADINVRENHVEIYVVEEEISGLRKAQREFPASVVLIGVDRLAQPNQLNGGESLSDCTGGFTVRSAIREMGISTAAHCSNTQSAQGQTLNFRREDQQGNQDVQWHSACGLLDVSDNFESGLGLRDVSGTRHRDNQVIGSMVCKFGKITGYTCGTIQSKSYAPSYVSSASSTFVRVDGGNLRLQRPGDSGGPWFVETVAYGIHIGSPGGDANDALYMPINYISDIGVSVLTSDPPGPACNICSANVCGGGRPPCCAGACLPGVGGFFTCQ